MIAVIIIIIIAEWSRQLLSVLSRISSLRFAHWISKKKWKKWEWKKKLSNLQIKSVTLTQDGMLYGPWAINEYFIQSHQRKRKRMKRKYYYGMRINVRLNNLHTIEKCFFFFSYLFKLFAFFLKSENRVFIFVGFSCVCLLFISIWGDLCKFNYSTTKINKKINSK